MGISASGMQPMQRLQACEHSVRVGATADQLLLVVVVGSAGFVTPGGGGGGGAGASGAAGVPAAPLGAVGVGSRPFTDPGSTSPPGGGAGGGSAGVAGASGGFTSSARTAGVPAQNSARAPAMTVHVSRTRLPPNMFPPNPSRPCSAGRTSPKVRSKFLIALECPTPRSIPNQRVPLPDALASTSATPAVRPPGRRTAGSR